MSSKIRTIAPVQDTMQIYRKYYTAWQHRWKYVLTSEAPEIRHGKRARKCLGKNTARFSIQDINNTYSAPNRSKSIELISRFAD